MQLAGQSHQSFATTHQSPNIHFHKKRDPSAISISMLIVFLSENHISQFFSGCWRAAWLTRQVGGKVRESILGRIGGLGEGEGGGSLIFTWLVLLFWLWWDPNEMAEILKTTDLTFYSKIISTFLSCTLRLEFGPQFAFILKCFGGNFFRSVTYFTLAVLGVLLINWNKLD